VNVLRGLARLAHPPGSLQGIDETARVAASARITPPVRIGPGARIGEGARVGPDTVIGRGAVVGTNVSVVRSVVWPDAQLHESAEDLIITSAGTRVSAA
jgi:UDP-3-O-[3-hydroxymyristoyl] glucosamine N-acyltransferase